MSVALTSPLANSGVSPARPTRAFRPLAVLLPERTTPELAYLQARFAGLVSYGVSATLLAELLPLGRPLHPTVIRRQVLNDFHRWYPGFTHTTTDQHDLAA